MPASIPGSNLQSHFASSNKSNEKDLYEHASILNLLKFLDVYFNNHQIYFMAITAVLVNGDFCFLHCFPALKGLLRIIYISI